MGVTYRYMGTSHSLGVDKEALIFFVVFLLISRRRLDREPSLSKRGKRSKADRAVNLILILNPMLDGI